MHPLPARYEPEKVEAEARAFWTERSLPPAGGVIGPPSGVRVHELFNALSPARGLPAFLAQAVRADIEARYQALTGRRAGAVLLARLSPNDPLFTDALAEIQRLAVWIGSSEMRPVSSAVDPARVQAAMARLAEKGLLARRDSPLRSCPRCGVARPPPAIVYSDEEGPAYLVRFPLVGENEPTSLVVWTDSTWKLLGTTAVLVHPDRPYVRARFRRRGQTELIVVDRAAVPRLARWLEGAEMEVLDEAPGSRYEGRVYAHPLSTEFPTLQGLPAPAGRVATAREVEDRGTGIVALVPAHGATDATVAQRLGVGGWPVLDPRGDLIRTLRHKYAGLTSDAAESFILRDLSDGGHLFAQVTVPRGLPRCAVCGAVCLWQPGSVWGVVPSKLPAERLEAARRVWPALVVPPEDDPVPWPVSELGTTPDPTAPQLRECAQCGTLAPPTAGPTCRCGSPTEVVHRRLLPSFQEALVFADRSGPYAPGDPLHFFLGERSAGVTLLQLLVALEGGGVPAAPFRLTVLPTVPPEATRVGSSADADRAAFLATTGPPRAGVDTIVARRVQAARRLRQIWQVAREVLLASTAANYTSPTAPIGAGLPQLPEEDRAFLSRFERMRLEVIRAYDSGDPVAARRGLARFFDQDLRGDYLPTVRPRLAAPGLLPPKVAALRVLHHVIPTWAELYAPIAPYTAETVLRAFRELPESVFERRLTPIQEAALDANLEQSYGRWQSFAATLRGFRRETGLPPDQPWPSVVIVASDEAVGSELRPAAATLARIARAERVEVASPEHPWKGKELVARPVAEEIQRAYGAQSGRILRILEGMNPHRLQEGLKAGTVQISMEGTTRPILPGMVEFSESLPPSIAVVPWAWGQLLVQLPQGQHDPDRPPTPALSADAWRVLRAVRRRVERSETPSAIDRVVVAAGGALLEELQRTGPAISALLGGIDFAARPTSEEFPAGESTEGRTGRGVRWRLWIPGLPTKVRSPKVRPKRPRRPRVRLSEASPGGYEGPDFLDEGLLAREAAVRSTVDGFENALGRPMIGPAKTSAAWDAGFRDLDSIAHAPYDQLAAVAGFGPTVAAEVLRHYGADVPRVVRRPRPTAPPAVAAAPAPPEPAPALPAPVPTLPASPTVGPPGPSPDVPEELERRPAPTVGPAIAVPPAVAVPPAPAPAPPVARVPAAPAPAPVAAPPPVASRTLAAPSAETLPPPAPGPEPGIELWPGATADPPWRAFLEATTAGVRGICVSREFPDRLKASLGPRPVEVYWLSNVGRQGSIRPGDLEAIADLFAKALETGGVTAVYLDGLEYLVRLHPMEKTLGFLTVLDQRAKEHGARVWIPLNVALIDPSAADMVRAAFHEHPPE